MIKAALPITSHYQCLYYYYLIDRVNYYYSLALKGAFPWQRGDVCCFSAHQVDPFPGSPRAVLVVPGGNWGCADVPRDGDGTTAATVQTLTPCRSSCRVQTLLQTAGSPLESSVGVVTPLCVCAAQGWAHLLLIAAPTPGWSEGVQDVHRVLQVCIVSCGCASCPAGVHRVLLCSLHWALLRAAGLEHG